MLDHYLIGSTSRISPEAPVPVVNVHKEQYLLGGAGNVLKNLVALGADAEIVAVIGDDEAGQMLLTELNAVGVTTTGVFIEKDRKTSKKSRVLSHNHQMLRIDFETTEPIVQKSFNSIQDYINKNLVNFDLIMLSDYAKGVLTPELCRWVIDAGNKIGVRTIVDPKGKSFSKYQNAYLVKPNRIESELATGISTKTEEGLAESLKKMKEDFNLTYSCVTLGEEGVAFYDDKIHKIPTLAQEVFDVTGAGDTVLASLGFCLANNISMHDAISFANAAAAVAVSRAGNATVTCEEVYHFQRQLLSVAPTKIIKREDAANFFKTLKGKIVFTNGCFDILHYGHLSYLKQASELGDYLVIGLNADASVKRLKGEGRPINNENERAALLAALEVVNFVVIFEEDTPYELIREVKPHTLVKGADYTNKVVVGSDIVEETILLEFVDGKSTTEILKKRNSQ